MLTTQAYIKKLNEINDQRLHLNFAIIQPRNKNGESHTVVTQPLLIPQRICWIFHGCPDSLCADRDHGNDQGNKE